MQTNRDRRIDIAVAVVLGSLALVGVGWAAVNELRVEVDDGFYYLQIARNVAEGGGSTFDGLNPTNGYHPLWMLCLVPIFWFTSQPATALVAAGVLQGVFFAAAVVFTYLAARLSLRRTSSIFAAAVWGTVSIHVALLGLEFSLHALCLFAAAWVYLGWFRAAASVRQSLILGGLLGLGILARLDSAVLAGLVVAWIGFGELRRGWQKGALLRLAAVVMPVALAVLGWCIFSFLVSGQLMPVSGAIKHGWAKYLLAEDPIFIEHGWLLAKAYQLIWPLVHLSSRWCRVLALGTFGVIALALAGLWPWARPLSRRTVGAWGPFALYGVVMFVLYSVNLHHFLSFFRWYYPLQVWLAALLLGHVAETGIDWLVKRPVRFAHGFPAAATLVLILLCGWLLFGAGSWLLRTRDYCRTDHNHRVFFNAAQWIRENLEPEVRVGSFNAGIIAFASGHTVINLDGLVNSWDFYQTRSSDLCRYWDEMEITYIIDIFNGDDVVSVVPMLDGFQHCLHRLEPVWVDDSYGSLWELRAYHVMTGAVLEGDL